MSLRQCSLETNRPDDIQSKLSNIKSTQILSNSANTHSKISQTSSIIDNGSARVYRRCRNSLKRKNQLKLNNTNKIENQSLNLIQNFSQEKNILQNLDEQKQAQLQRAMYNARQTPLIPLITDIDFPCLFESSQRQNDLLINIANLLNNINEKCSFFEQFRI